MADYRMDLAAFRIWKHSDNKDNAGDLVRLKKALRVALADCVTPTQRRYIVAYFIHRKSLEEISKMYNVNISTVSRGIHGGMNKIYDRLRFASNLVIDAHRRQGRLSNGRRRKNDRP